MAEESGDSCAGTGCGCLTIIVILAVVVSLVESYAKNVSATGALIGGLVGACAGAGIAALIAPLAKGHREKAKLGPLPLLAHFLGVAGMRRKYLGAQPPDANQAEDGIVTAEVVDK